MSSTLSKVVPWGRSFAEYERMFAICDIDLRGRILGCADGPSSFNAEATSRGSSVTSIDPLYQFSAAEIKSRIDAAYPEIIENARRNQHEFIWNDFPSVDALGQARMRAMG